MPLPSKRTSHSKQGKRRSHLALHRVTLTICPQCKAAIRPHMVCPECGYYRGRHVRTIESVVERKRRKEKERDSAKKSPAKPSAKDQKKDVKKEAKQDSVESTKK